MEILHILLPVIFTLALGSLSSRFRWFEPDGVKTLKSIVCKIILPVILFDAFLFNTYSKDVIVVIAVIFAAFIGSLFTGIFLKKKTSGSKYLPVLLTTTEGGVLGYPLVLLIMGTAGLQRMALVDIGQTIFNFGIVVTFLRGIDGKKADIKGLAKTVFSSPPIDAILLGIILSLCGVGTLLDSSPAGELYRSVVDFIKTPATFLILLAVGYEIRIDRSTIALVAKTELLRLLNMCFWCAVSCLVIFAVIPFDRTWLYAIVFTFVLPTSYGIITFSDFEGESEYVSTFISFSTLISLVIYLILTVLYKL